MRPKARKSCPNCRHLQAKLDAQAARLKALEATVARLQEQLAAARKDSSTSSKPPSSDIVKPPKPAPPEGQDRRRIGGQPGHPKHEPADFPPELINGGSFDFRLDLCPRCGHDLQPMPTIVPRVIQQVDINDVPLVIQEHRGHPGWCSHCQKVYEAPLPIGIERGGLVGPKLTTMIAYLKGVCHALFSTVPKFVRDVVRLEGKRDVTDIDTSYRDTISISEGGRSFGDTIAIPGGIAFRLGLRAVPRRRMDGEGKHWHFPLGFHTHTRRSDPTPRQCAGAEAVLLRSLPPGQIPANLTRATRGNRRKDRLVWLQIGSQ